MVATFETVQINLGIRNPATLGSPLNQPLPPMDNGGIAGWGWRLHQAPSWLPLLQGAAKCWGVASTVSRLDEDADIRRTRLMAFFFFLIFNACLGMMMMMIVIPKWLWVTHLCQWNGSSINQLWSSTPLALSWGAMSTSLPGGSGLKGTSTGYLEMHPSY